MRRHYNCKVCDHVVMFAATVKASSFATEDGHAAALEESSPASEKKRRLSRQERTALVESFVIKCVNITLLLEDRIIMFSVHFEQ